MYLHFNKMLIDGILVAEHNDYDDSDYDYSDSVHLIYDYEDYQEEDIY